MTATIAAMVGIDVHRSRPVTSQAGSGDVVSGAIPIFMAVYPDNGFVRYSGRPEGFAGTAKAADLRT